MKLYIIPLAGRFFNSRPLLHAAISPSAYYRPRQGAEAQHRKPSPSRRQETWGIGGMSYLNGKIVYTGVGRWDKLRAQTRAEAKGAEIKNSDEQEWAVNPTDITALPPCLMAGTNGRQWHTIGH